MKRLICSLLAVMLAVFMVGSCALAEAGVILQNVTVGENMLRLIVKSGDSSYLQPTDFEISLDRQTVAAQSLNSFERSDLATTHVYIVDVSAMSTSSGNRIADMKATLNKLIDNLPAGDNAAVVTTGVTASGISLSGDRGLLRATVDSLQFNKSLTSLDRTIREVCTFLTSASGLNARANIVILSNGENETLNTAVISELGEKIAGSRATAYTMAFKKYKANDSTLSGYSLLARKSKGGIALETEYISQNKPIGDAEVSRLVSQIQDNERLFFVLDVPLAADMPDFASITVKFQSGNLTYTDTLTLTNDQREAIAAAVAALAGSSGGGGTTAGGEIINNEEEKTFWEKALEYAKANVVIVVCGAVILVLVIVLIVVLARGKKSVVLDDVTSEDTSKTVIGGMDDKTMIDGGNGFGKTEPVSDMLVHFIPVSQGDVMVRNVPAMINGSLQIGRRDDQCQIVIASSQSDADIRTVSRVHARVTLQGDALVIENLSQNGTKVNNVKLTRPMVLQQNDIVTLGAVSFRISWMRG